MDLVQMDSKLYIDLIGKPYKVNCAGPDFYDCFGLIYEIYRRMGVTLPDVNDVADSNYDEINIEVNKAMPLYEKLPKCQPGCIIAFRANKRLITHVGIAIDHCNMIHIRKGIGVSVTRFDSPAWQAKLEGYYTYG